MKKFFIILIQILTFLIGIALLIWVKHPMSYLLSFILYFSAWDSFLWMYVYQPIYNVKKKDIRVIGYRISQILIQIGYIWIGLTDYNWWVASSTVVVWFMGFEDLCYFWLNQLTVCEYLDWMESWSFHAFIKWCWDKNYKCTRLSFLVCAYIGLFLGMLIIII